MTAGNQLARWFVVAVLGLNAIDQMFFIPPLREAGRCPPVAGSRGSSLGQPGQAR